MSMEEQRLLSQDETVQEYLQYLFKTNMNDEHEDTKQLINSVDFLEQQFNILFDEIKELRHTVERLQNPEVKSRITMVLEKVEYSFVHAKAKVDGIKRDIKVQMKLSLMACKNKGKNAMIKTIDLIHLKNGIANVCNSLNHTKELTKSLVNRIDQVTMETRKAKVNIGNIGKVLLGKPVMKYEEDKSRLNVLQKMSRSISSSITTFQKDTADMLKRLESLERSSVKQDIKQLSGSKEKSQKKKLNLER